MASYKSNFETVRVCMGHLMGIHHRVPLWVWIIDKYHQKAQLIFRTTKQRNVLLRHIKIIYWTTCCHDTCAFSGLPISLVMIVKICVFFLLASANRKNQPLALLYGLVMKQWYVLYVFLCLNGCSFIKHIRALTLIYQGHQILEWSKGTYFGVWTNSTYQSQQIGHLTKLLSLVFHLIVQLLTNCNGNFPPILTRAIFKQFSTLGKTQLSPNLQLQFSCSFFLIAI